MKAETPGHIKTKKLKLILKLPLYQVAGILEMLWNFAVNCADDGAVGRYSNEDIAAYLEYDGDPDALIAALVHCRWLDVDEDPGRRLVVHDWEEERPYYVGERIRKREDRRDAKKSRTRPPDTPENSGRVQETADASAKKPDSRTQPNPTKPNQTKPNPYSIDGRLSLEAIDRLRPTAAELFRKTGYSGSKGLTFWKTAALLDAGKVPWDAVETVAALTRANSTKNPPGYFRTTLVKELKTRGIDFEALLGGIRMPKTLDRGPPGSAAPDSTVLALVNSLSRKES